MELKKKEPATKMQETEVIIILSALNFQIRFSN